MAGAFHQGMRTASQTAYAPSSNNPVPVGADLKSGISGAGYTEAITTHGGTSPYTFSISSGALPTGCTLNSTSGIISGTPTVTGSFSFTVSVTDSSGNSGSQAFVITVTTGTSGGYAYAFVG